MLVQLELPEELYKQAEHVAKVTQRPLEQVVVEWIQPPPTPGFSNVQEALDNLECLSDDELLRLAHAAMPVKDSQRLQALLEIQQRRDLTAAEQNEAASLVEQEDLLTLRKAKAMFLLKQRNALPNQINMITRSTTAALPIRR